MTRCGACQLAWVVPPRGASRLGTLLDRLDGVDRTAVSEGRVFVDGRRAASPTERVRDGQRIEVYAARVAAGSIEVLDERDGLLAVCKPAGVPTEPDRRGSSASLVRQLAHQLGVAPGTLHAASRLDLGVSGIVLVATTASARRAVRLAHDEGRLIHRYLSIAVRAPRPPHGSWTTPLAGPRRGGGQRLRRAVTRYRCAAEVDLRAARATVEGTDAVPALLVVEPQTGRLHQIRAHASGAGAALLGDRSHGGPVRLVQQGGQVQQLERVMLHASRIVLHSTDGMWWVEARVPGLFRELWCDLGGREGDLAAALGGDEP